MKRTTLPGARDDKLFFGQVREDPQAELQALQLSPADTVVVVTSGGCSALSMLAAGAGRVVGVDLNTAQNSLAELKVAALTKLAPADAVRFLGGWPASRRMRSRWYKELRSGLSPWTRAYWDQHKRSIRHGVIDSGACERFLRVISFVIRRFVHSPARISQLLACADLPAQQRFYDQTWNSRRWRLLFRLLVNRVTFRKAFHPAFFEHVENPSFSRHFLHVCGKALTEAPIGDNYFFHQILTGRYPSGRDSGLPPYLQAEGITAIRSTTDNVEFVDAAFGDYLATLADGSVNAFALSNILEWNTDKQIEALFEQVVRTAAPGARLVFRNFVGWTEIPDRFRERIVVNPDLGEQVMRGERSGMQRRVVAATVN